VPNVLRSFPFEFLANVAALAPLLVAVVAVSALWARRRGLPLRAAAVTVVGTLAIALHVVAVLTATRIGELFAGGAARDPEAVSQLQWLPFGGIAGYLHGGVSATAVAELGGNVVLLLPLGLLVPLTARKDPGWRVMLVVGVVASVVIEVLQWGFALGVAGVDDVLLNTAGVALGYAGYRAVRRPTRWQPHQVAARN
jgi:glycopeptide antibiotics resistance protein